ncbi:MAG: hypothetical protein P8X83_07110 [Nitrosopumilaceae archaeon]
MKHVPTNEEITFEKSNIENTSITENIIMYDGFQLQKVFADFTYDYNDYRYHGRALIGANPSIISTTGIIEAPAKPKGYYYELMTNFTRGVNVDFVKEKFKGSYLEYHDSRLSKIIEGYLLQSIFYYETGEPFCDNKDCKLLNAHWQKDLIYSQLESGKLCEKHLLVLEKMISK